MATIGQNLSEARHEAGLTLEDVAHRTKIHRKVLQVIEEDDYSAFPSVAYARGFVRRYSEFLAVDVSKALEALHSDAVAPWGDSECIQEMKRTIRKDGRFRAERRSRRASGGSSASRGSPVFLNLILSAIAICLALFYFLGFHADTPEEARSEIIRGLEKVVPFAKSRESDPGDFPPNPLGESFAARSPEDSAAESSDAAAPGTPASPRIERPPVAMPEEAPPALRQPGPLRPAESARLRPGFDSEGRGGEADSIPMPRPVPLVSGGAETIPQADVQDLVLSPVGRIGLTEVWIDESAAEG